MKKVICIIILFLIVSSVYPGSPNRYNLIIAPGTITDHSVAILWDKQYGEKETVYEIMLNGKLAGSTTKTNYILNSLRPLKSYTVSLRLRGTKANKENLIRFKTTSIGKVFNILDFGAKSDAGTNNTKAIQAAIDACTNGGTVYIPKGTFVSGAIYLKSNMTLFIEPGGVLKGSTDTSDYLPLIYNRFEGWEMPTYASLVNAGTLSRNGSFNVQNLCITGGGTIEGGGKKLGNAMIATRGIRSRGRLILLMNCENVSISNLTIEEPPCWTIHYLYSKNISLHDLVIKTYGIRNGDGIDPDSSTDSYIFNCTFDTGDDCIAIKSGKNPEGYYIGKPTKNVRITDCDFIRGHGISIGSEMSGGVSDVLVQDCKAGPLINGMQIKGTKERGGYVRNVTVADCELMKITIFSKLNYNNDGAAAPTPPVFENFVFRNIDLTKADSKEPVININGFNDPAYKLRNVVFANVTLHENGKISITDAQNVKFTRVKTIDGSQPEYLVKESSNIVY